MANAGPRNRASDARGVGRLAVGATLGLADLVEALHHNIVRAPWPLGRVERSGMRGIPGLVYRTIRGVTRLVGGGIDLLLGQVEPLLAREPSSARREAVLAALNGVLGDHLAATGNPLAIPMRLRRGGVPLELTPAALAAAIPGPARRVAVLVHGLCLGDLQWERGGHDHGAALERDSASTTRRLTTLYLNYNTGCHVSTNGHALAAILEALAQAWPVPLEEIAILAHSMGGLVARSACAYGSTAGCRWPRLLRAMVFLGTPHAGAPLERGGNWVDRVLDASPYTAAFARIGKVRSAGITDLRYGSVLDEDWAGRDRFAPAAEARTPVALPAGVAGYAIAGNLARRTAGPHAGLASDGLVPVSSALGAAAGPGGAPLFAPERQWIARGTGHLGLLGSRRVYRRVRDYFSETTRQTVAGQG